MGRCVNVASIRLISSLSRENAATDLHQLTCWFLSSGLALLLTCRAESCMYSPLGTVNSALRRRSEGTEGRP